MQASPDRPGQLPTEHHGPTDQVGVDRIGTDEGGSGPPRRGRLRARSAVIVYVLCSLTVAVLAWSDTDSLALVALVALGPIFVAPLAGIRMTADQLGTWNRLPQDGRSGAVWYHAQQAGGVVTALVAGLVIAFTLFGPLVGELVGDPADLVPGTVTASRPPWGAWMSVSVLLLLAVHTPFLVLLWQQALSGVQRPGEALGFSPARPGYARREVDELATTVTRTLLDEPGAVDRPKAARQVTRARFRKARKGYDMGQVDAWLEESAARLGGAVGTPGQDG